MSYNLKCSVSNLPIQQGDSVILLPISPSFLTFGMKISQRKSAIPIKNFSCFLENSDVFNMLNGYFECTYLDDGTLFDIKPSLANDLFVNRYGLSADKLFNILTENHLNISSPILNIFKEDNSKFLNELTLDVFISYLNNFGFSKLSDNLYIIEYNKYTYLVEINEVDLITNKFKVHIYAMSDEYFNYDKEINPYELTETKEIFYDGRSLIFNKLSTLWNRLVNSEIKNHIGFIDSFAKTTNMYLGFKRDFQHIIFELLSMNFMVVRKDIVDLAFSSDLLYSNEEDIKSAILNFKEYKQVFKDYGDDVLSYTSFMLLSTLLKDYVNSGEEILKYINTSEKELDILAEEIVNMVKYDSLLKQFLHQSGTVYMPTVSVSIYDYPEVIEKILKKSKKVLGEILDENRKN